MSVLPQVPVGIVAHYSRHERAEKLAELIEAEIISVDHGGIGPGKNHELCYEWLAESKAPWVVLLEDDAIPVKDFRTQLNAVLRAAPKTGLMSLYLGRSRPPHWQISIARVIAGDENYFMASELLHHVAVAIRPNLIPGMLKYIRNDTAYADGKLPIDEAVGAWARSLSMPIVYSNPSIVNHDARTGTIIKRHVSQHKTDDGKRASDDSRKAWRFGPREEWQTTIATIPNPIMRNPAASSSSPLKK